MRLTYHQSSVVRAVFRVGGLVGAEPDASHPVGANHRRGVMPDPPAALKERLFARLLVGRAERQFTFLYTPDQVIGADPPDACAYSKEHDDHRAYARSGEGNGQTERQRDRATERRKDRGTERR